MSKENAELVVMKMMYKGLIHDFTPEQRAIYDTTKARLEEVHTEESENLEGDDKIVVMIAANMFYLEMMEAMES